MGAKDEPSYDGREVNPLMGKKMPIAGDNVALV